MRRMDRRGFLAVASGVAAAGVAATLGSCGRGAPDTGGPLPGGGAWSGGPVTPTAVPVTINPSALPLGNAMATGIVLDGWELILDIWEGPPTLYLDQNWYEQASSTMRADPPRQLGGGADDTGGKMCGLTQWVVGDGTLIEYGVVLAPAAKVEVSDGGHATEARFCRWSEDAGVTVWWLRRPGAPIPPGIRITCGQVSPRPAAQYPKITATDKDGKVLVTDWLRPVQAGPYCDG